MPFIARGGGRPPNLALKLPRSSCSPQGKRGLCAFQQHFEISPTLITRGSQQKTSNHILVSWALHGRKAEFWSILRSSTIMASGGLDCNPVRNPALHPAAGRKSGLTQSRVKEGRAKALLPRWLQRRRARPPGPELAIKSRSLDPMVMTKSEGSTNSSEPVDFLRKETQSERFSSPSWDLGISVRAPRLRLLMRYKAVCKA